MSLLADKIEARMSEPIEWVVPNPKPPKRGPKPKAYIKRSTRPARVRRTEGGKAKQAADVAWRKAILAKGPCFALGKYPGNLLHDQCGGGRIDPAHLISTRFLATRHDPENGVPLCRWVHDWFTRRHKAWTAFLIENIGLEKYEALRQKALAGPKGRS